MEPVIGRTIHDRTRPGIIGQIVSIGQLAVIVLTKERRRERILKENIKMTGGNLPAEERKARKANAAELDRQFIESASRRTGISVEEIRRRAEAVGLSVVEAARALVE